MAFDIFTYRGTKITVDVDIESDEITDAAINVYSGTSIIKIYFCLKRGQLKTSGDPVGIFFFP